MKKFFLSVLGLGLFFGVDAVAQTAPKVGHTNTTYIVTQLPDTKKAQTELETVRTQLEKVIQDKSKTFQEKVERYQAGAASMSEQTRTTTETELQKLRGELEELQTKSEKTFMDKQESLFKPIMDKVNKAIKDVAKEQGYSYIINGDTGSVGNPVILYSGSEDSDITNLVLKKLGVTATN